MTHEDLLKKIKKDMYEATRVPLYAKIGQLHRTGPASDSEHVININIHRCKHCFRTVTATTDNTCELCGKRGDQPSLYDRLGMPNDPGLDPRPDMHKALDELDVLRRGVDPSKLAAALFETRLKDEAFEIADRNADRIPEVLAVMWSKTKTQVRDACLAEAAVLVAIMSR